MQIPCPYCQKILTSDKEYIKHRVKAYEDKDDVVHGEDNLSMLIGIAIQREEGE